MAVASVIELILAQLAALHFERVAQDRPGASRSSAKRAHPRRWPALCPWAVQVEGVARVIESERILAGLHFEQELAQVIGHELAQAAVSSALHSTMASNPARCILVQEIESERQIAALYFEGVSSTLARGIEIEPGHRRPR